MANHDERRADFIQRLPSRSLRKACTAIDLAIADASSFGSVAWSYDEVSERCRIGRASVSRVLRALQLLGLVTITSGIYRVSVLSQAHGYKDLSATDIADRLAKARLPKLGRPHKQSAPATPKQPKVIRQAEPDDEESDAIEIQRGIPSLPKLEFMRDWPEISPGRILPPSVTRRYR